MLSSPTYNIPRELICYILSIKSHQAWKEHRAKLHKSIRHSVLPNHVEVDEDYAELQLYIHYERDYPISNVYPLKHITILADWGYESEDDPEWGHSQHRDHSWILECHSSCETYCSTDCGCSSPEDEEDDVSRHFHTFDNTERLICSSHFTTSLWTKRDNGWILY